MRLFVRSDILFTESCLCILIAALDDRFSVSFLMAIVGYSLVLDSVFVIG